MLNKSLITFGKIVTKFSRTFNLGHGSTWPGHIALNVNKNFISQILKNNRIKVIIIAGTNGKTTTSKLIRTILETDGKKVFQNESGANLLNGIASSIILNTRTSGKLDKDFAVFEIDENSLPLVLNELTPDYLILMNLFRDQLDRYGEVNTIANKWQRAIEQLSNRTIVVLNADDPQIAYLGLSLCHPELDLGSRPRFLYFGLNDKKLAVTKHQHAADSTYCPNCSTKLNYEAVFFSHLGLWNCPDCKLSRPKTEKIKIPKSNLIGVYNQYNLLAAALMTKTAGIDQKIIDSAVHNFKPAFGRQEVLEINGKKIQIFLSKNPTGFNQSFRTIQELKAKNLLLVLNDQIPDGRDVSWIWDVDFEDFIKNFQNITISGDRCYDLGLRVKYSSACHLKFDSVSHSVIASDSAAISNGGHPGVATTTIESSSDSIATLQNDKPFQIEQELKKAISIALQKTPKTETLSILPTYSAMLEVRKILTGKKIL